MRQSIEKMQERSSTDSGVPVLSIDVAPYLSGFVSFFWSKGGLGLPALSVAFGAASIRARSIISRALNFLHQSLAASRRVPSGAGMQAITLASWALFARANCSRRGGAFGGGIQKDGSNKITQWATLPRFVAA